MVESSVYKSLVEFRRIKKLTQARMAMELGVSLSFYQKVEIKTKKPSREFLRKLKDAYPEFDLNIFFDQ